VSSAFAQSIREAQMGAANKTNMQVKIDEQGLSLVIILRLHASWWWQHLPGFQHGRRLKIKLP
jgi:hypothetical protein